MIAWCVLLVSQAYLIRSNNRPLHRQLGKTSFGLVPLIVISTLALAHYRLKPNDGSDLTLYSLALPAFALCQLLVAYGLAIYNRRNPVIHARFMICTALVMIPAIFDRIMIFFLLPPEQAQFLPDIGGFPLYSMITFGIMDTILVFLIAWDWKSRKRLNVFPVVLGAWVVCQWLTFNVHKTDGWRSITEWYLRLPLS